MIEPRDRELGNGDALFRGELLAAAQALVVFGIVEALDAELVEDPAAARLVVAVEAAGQESVREAGVRDDGHLVFAVPALDFFRIFAADGDASAAVRVDDLPRQRKVRARHLKRDQAVSGGVVVCFLNALPGPVGAAESADLALFVHVVEDLDDLTDRHFRIVAVQDVDIDVIRLQEAERCLEVLEHFLAVDTLAERLGVVVPALREKHDLVPVVSRVQPLAERLLGVAVHARRVQRRDTEVQHSVEKLHAAFPAVVKRMDRRAIDDP